MPVEEEVEILGQNIQEGILNKRDIVGTSEDVLCLGAWIWVNTLNLEFFSLPILGRMINKRRKILGENVQISGKPMATIVEMTVKISIRSKHFLAVKQLQICMFMCTVGDFVLWPFSVSFPFNHDQISLACYSSYWTLLFSPLSSMYK